jgi:hypothetical protein
MPLFFLMIPVFWSMPFMTLQIAVYETIERAM